MEDSNHVLNGETTGSNHALQVSNQWMEDSNHVLNGETTVGNHDHNGEKAILMFVHGVGHPAEIFIREIVSLIQEFPNVIFVGREATLLINVGSKMDIRIPEMPITNIRGAGQRQEEKITEVNMVRIFIRGSRFACSRIDHPSTGYKQ